MARRRHAAPQEDKHRLGVPKATQEIIATARGVLLKEPQSFFPYVPLLPTSITSDVILLQQTLCEGKLLESVQLAENLKRTVAS